MLKKFKTENEANNYLIEESDKTPVYIQWKGTDVCLDFICPKCRASLHFDTYFLYNVKCGHCNKLFKLGYSVEVVEIEGPLTLALSPKLRLGERGSKCRVRGKHNSFSPCLQGEKVRMRG